MSRTPPSKLRLELRREVGFRCPIPGCGSPYLTWHHFDPPWQPQHRHNPPGMIALCPTCHELADGGKWTPQQLRQLKASGKQGPSHVRGHNWGWLRYKLLGALGNNLCYDTPILFYTSRQPIIWFKRDAEGYLQANLRRPRTAFSADAVIEDNDWLVSRDMADIECPPGGRRLAVTYPNGDVVGVGFRELESVGQARKRFPLSTSFLADLEYPLMSVDFHVRIPALGIYIGPNEMRWPHKSTISGCTVKSCDAAFALGPVVHKMSVGINIE
jgi:hypothetical protein